MSDPHATPLNGAEPQPSSSTSRSLLERVKGHDEAAWQRLVVLYAPLVLAWCRRWQLQEQDAADILQEVFQAVLVHVADFQRRPEGGTFRGWLRVITHNKIHDHFRRRGRETPGAGGSEAQERLAQFAVPPKPEPEGAGGELEERRLLYRALDGIRAEFEDRTWQAFWRTAVDGRAPKDVAAELSMSPGAVRVAKSRVLHRLREELGDLVS
jgi:RNA polymerase sigma-70 factor (ECF subfamily)